MFYPLLSSFNTLILGIRMTFFNNFKKPDDSRLTMVLKENIIWRCTLMNSWWSSIIFQPVPHLFNITYPESKIMHKRASSHSPFVMYINFFISSWPLLANSGSPGYAAVISRTISVLTILLHLFFFFFCL
jgi:hypothetical protein